MANNATTKTIVQFYSLCWSLTIILWGIKAMLHVFPEKKTSKLNETYRDAYIIFCAWRHLDLSNFKLYTSRMHHPVFLGIICVPVPLVCLCSCALLVHLWRFRPYQQNFVQPQWEKILVNCMRLIGGCMQQN